MQINAGNSKIVHHVLVFNDQNHALDPKLAARMERLTQS